jgi:hypothetical protein
MGGLRDTGQARPVTAMARNGERVAGARSTSTFRSTSTLIDLNLGGIDQPPDPIDLNLGGIDRHPRSTSTLVALHRERPC